MLLFLTNLQDFASDYLADYLRGRERPYARFNAEQLAAADMTLYPDRRAGQLVVSGMEIDLAKVRSVLFRRSFAGVVASTAGTDEFALRERVHVLQGALLACPARWVNPMAATVAAERKLFQLAMAVQCGFEIPPSLLTTSPDEARAFLARHPRAIVKPVSYGFLRAPDGGAFAAHTERVSMLGPDEAEAIAATPTLLQAEVERGTDYRVTAVGARLFVTQVRFAPAIHVDWRVPEVQTSFADAPGALPESVKRAIGRLMQKLGLIYGAFDLIHSGSGRWVFLEVNPAGEWAWIEEATGVPIRAAFEELLYE